MRGKHDPEQEKCRLELYQQGLSDKEIAERLGDTYIAIGQWRFSRSLPSNGRQYQRLSPEEHEARMLLYRQGLNDREIAKALGVRYQTIAGWRYIHHLSANVSQGRHLPGQGNSQPPTMNLTGGVPMSRALSPDGCDLVRQFLRTLKHLGDRCKRPSTSFHPGILARRTFSTPSLRMLDAPSI